MANEQMEQSDVIEIDLLEVAFEMRKLLFKFFIPIILFIGLSGFGTYYYIWYNYEPIYEASASFVISTNLSYSSSYYDNATAEQMSKTFPYIVTSGVLRNVVAKDVGGGSVSASNITAEVMENTNLFTIKVRDKTPSRAYDVLNSVIINYPIVAEYIIGATTMTIVDESGIPTAPINEDASIKSAGMGALAAAAIVLGIMLIYIIRKKTIRSAEDIQKVTNAKFLGNIPVTKIKKRSKMKGQAYMIDNPKIDSNYKEAFRLVRTRLHEKLSDFGDCPVILVTSSLQGEGKSTVAANIAMSLVNGGSNVAIIDGDLRHPNLLQVMGMRKTRQGVSDILRGNVKVSSVLTSYNSNRLYVVGGNQSLRRPVSFIKSPEMKQMITDLKQMVNYIIIDTPACSVLSDAAAYADVADTAVFVIRQDTVDENQVLKGLEMITDVNIPIAGCVLNCVDEGSYGYGYYSRYGYSKYGYRRYGYGYGRQGYGYGESSSENDGYSENQENKPARERRSRRTDN